VTIKQQVSILASYSVYFFSEQRKQMLVLNSVTEDNYVKYI